VVSDLFEENVAFIPFDVVERELDLDNDESPFELTATQEAVVEMAMNGQNIFLTGAAGSGKTATLKEILRRLRKKYSEGGGKDPTDAGGNTFYVQVVAPTGIAALSLNGRTTYPFAGWYVRPFLSMWFLTSIHLS
jgi:Cdc6-like AAA superfamily ATPase